MEACNIVNVIINWLTEEALQEIEHKTSSTTDSNQTFGEGLHFSPPKKLPTKDDFSWLEMQCEEIAQSSFDMKFTDTQLQRLTEKKHAGVDAGWLRNQLTIAYGGDETGMGMAITDLSTALFDLLASNKADSELQNQVVRSA
jgi:hypothetical protein